MAAQTAEQKAEAAKAAAEQKAAEEQAAAEQAAADELAAEQAKAAAAAAAAEVARVKAAEKAAEQLQVIGPVAVLPLAAGGERYVYRGSPVGAEFTEAGIAHAKSVGLVGTPKPASE
ncbi:hypothetical protein [Pseudoclavibacter helvolus]|uniref:hypothetical protein n=1 Tax=Pseudoclavibacter helvolus TaxID=255205 RepID=UPI003736F795